MHVQSRCFAYQTHCFFGVLVAVAVVIAKTPYYLIVGGGGRQELNLKHFLVNES